MPPKQKGSSGQFLRENALNQAVLVADSFDDAFSVLTTDRPKAMIPVLNKPMIDYSLNLLKDNGFHEVFLFCRDHHQQIRQHVKQFWSDSQMSVHVFSSDSYISPGDVYRDLDSKNLVKGEFVLIHGDVISNLQLSKLMDEHRERKKLDKNCIMTSIFRKLSVDHKTRSRKDEVTVVYAASGKILAYERGDDGKRIRIPIETFQRFEKVQIQRDFVDAHIGICSLNFLMLFTENVDYQNKGDFIRGTLVDEELHGHSIYVQVVDQGYASRITTPHLYDVVSQDLLSRHNYPCVPEKFDGYLKRQNNVYLPKSNRADALRCCLHRNVLIGHGSSLGQCVNIKNSVIGSRCKIGSNVTMDGVYIWDNVIIEDGCKLSACILSNYVHVKKGATIEGGCLLSSSVIIGPGIKLNKCCIVSTKTKNSDAKLVGKDGNGILWVPDADSDDESETKTLNPWGDEVSDEEGDSGDDDESGSEIQENDEQMEDEFNVFYHELLDNFKRGVIEKINCENLILEVNSVKHAYNIPIDDVNVLVMQALLQLPEHLTGILDGTYAVQLKEIFTIFSDLVRNYIKSNESQSTCLRAMEEYCLHKQDKFTTNVLCKMIMKFYEDDVLEDYVILEWYEACEPLPRLIQHSSREVTESDQKKLRRDATLIKLTKWLEESDEESE